MNKKQINKKIVSIVLAFVMLFSLLPTMQLSAATVPKTIAEWKWTAYPAFPAKATGGEQAEATLTYSNVAKNGATTYTPTNGSISINNWQSGREYWLLTVPKEGYRELKLSFDTFSSGSGPRDFRVEVSTDGTIFSDVTNGTYINGTGHTAELTKDALPLPSGVDTADLVYIKILNTSTTNANNVEGIADTGSSRLYNVTITGETIGGGGESTKVRAVTANPASGAVAIGTKITLSTVTSGSAIQYRLNEGAVTSGSAIILDESAFVGEPATATIKAIATKEGLEDSDEAIFTYTKQGLVTIAQARAQGTGSASVEGVVTRAIQSSGTNLTNCTLYIQDDTAGIAVFKGGISLATYPIGKKVKVTGNLREFNGVLQLAPASLSDILDSPDSASPRVPEEITIDQLNTKKYEGKLVKILGVKLSAIATNSNHTILDENTNASLTMRCTENTTLPSDKFVVDDTIDVVGIAANNKGTPQLLVSKIEDITQGIAPAVAPVTATPEDGGTVPLGGTVTLATKTNGATIQYVLNGGAEQTIGSNTGTVTISEFNQPGDTAIIKAKATDGSYTTREKTFVYKQAKVAQVQPSLPTGAVKAGSQVELTTTTTGSSIKYIMTKKVGTPDQTIDLEITYSKPIILTEDMLPVKITVYASAPNYLDSEKVDFNYRLKVGGSEKNYYGQLHAHTAENSDGAGTLVEAYSWARDNAKLDFFAVTDHSNAFDTAPKTDKAGVYNLGDYNKNNEKWQNGLNAATNARTADFVSVYGYEMTWSGGPGHMNTFNTEGFVSRNNTELNSKAGDAGLRAYYELLKQYPNSISQFNHPGETFGTFNNFGYYDPIVDERISLIEVGNGEGAVGSGGYFTSYEQYDKALDKGWHLAPTNNQDNHKKGWGTSNTARTVIYTSDFSVDGMYQALHEMRVYATEDNNLDIVYTLNAQPLGTIIDTVPENAIFSAVVEDPDVTDKISSISIISNGGKTVYSQSFNEQNAVLDYTMSNPKAGYYYIKVVQADGHIAVTAPVWLGKAPAVGIASLKSSATMPVTTEELTLTTELFNNENTAANLKTISYDLKNGANIASFSPNTTIESSRNYIHTQKFMPTTVGTNTVIVTAEVEINGEIKTFTSEIELKVRDITKLVFVGIDASHYNEYVNGNYKDSMGNFGKLAAEYDLRTVELKTSADLLAALENPKYKMMVFTAASRRDGTTGRVPYATYSDEEINAIANFAASGNTVIIAGWGDYYENYANVKDDGIDLHMAGQQNKLLKAMGATLRISDDGVLDDVNNGGQSPRLYLTDYNNFVSPLTKGIIGGVEGQVYSNYGGATIHAVNEDGTPALTLPTSVMPIISGHATTYSKDQDGDGYGFEDKTTTIPKYNDRVMVTASETLTHAGGVTSEVIVSGAAFMSNFEIQATVENAGTLNYSNYNILENIIATINPVGITSIADVKKAPAGTEFTIQGIATSSIFNGTDNNKGFFDCIYMQDTTGGINLFPVAQGVEAGQTIRVTGKVSAYQGETQLAVSKVSVIDAAINPVPPTVIGTGNAMLPENTGRLIKTTGIVKAVVKDEKGVVGQIILDDGSGPALVYINGYITKSGDLSFVQVGRKVSAIGLTSIGENFQSQTDFLPRIRVRDRGEIVLVDSSPGGGDPGNGGGGGSSSSGGGSSEVSAEKAITKLTTTEKEAIKKTIEKEMPYTVLGNGLTVDQLDKLTNHKFTKKQLEEMLKNPKLLTAVGIELEKTTKGITLGKVEQTEFKDLLAKHWAYNSVMALAKKGIVVGTAEGNFNPKENLKVSDTFTFLDRVLLLNNVTEMKLPRNTVEKYITDKEHWAFANVASVSSKMSENTLSVIAALGDKSITRELLAQVLFEVTGGKLIQGKEAKAFTDILDSPYKEALEYCVKAGLLQGTTATNLSPQKELTRAELMIVLQRLDKQLSVVNK